MLLHSRLPKHFTSSSSYSGVSSSASVAPTTGYIYGHTYVDLGLSVNWATCNVGASSPEDYGYYYAWGETTPKSSYDEENSVMYGVSWSTDISGNAKYDAARANWGGSWRLPTKEECQELLDKCELTWVKNNGVTGCQVKSIANGNSIFLPAAGAREGFSLDGVGYIGRYWCSTPESGTGSSYSLMIEYEICDVSWLYRGSGFSVPSQ